ncbi:MAG: ATP-binding protein, partial [Bacteroides sp.]|uniref:sensor histidine kinase n=2 Tax=Bacteroides sp. TaxID=29523 RepID=UPI002FCAF0C4
VFSEVDKVLVLSSYGTDYQWSNSIADAIHRELKKEFPNIEFSREFLSSEFLDTADTWGDKVSVLLANYRKNPPLAIVLISDEAWMAYQDADFTEFENVPLLLCAVKPHTICTHTLDTYQNSLRLSYFRPTIEVMKHYNATGVLRAMNVSGYLGLMNNLIPDLDRFTFITDGRFYGIYTRLLLEQEVKRSYPDIPVDYLDARSITTDSLLRKLPEVTPTTGVLLTSWLTGNHGFEYSKDHVYSQMELDLQAPIFITNNIGLDKEYFVGGYFNTSSFWGKRTADQLIQILRGKSPRQIETTVEYDEQCRIAWKVFERYKLDKDNLPANTIFYNYPRSFFSIYKYYIIVGSVLLAILILFYLYTLRSNIKLHSAKRLLLQSVAETEKANAKLKATHEELTKALHKAEESDRLKSAFLANMSHEIRTPLNAIVGFSGVIVDMESKEERMEFADLIHRNSDLLLHLISDILDESKIEAGMLELHFEKVDALDISLHVVAALQDKCARGVVLSLHPSCESISLHTDPNRLMQLLNNLVCNALKFTREGTITVGYFACGDEQIEFFVEDTGIGIPADKHGDIFERFTKLDSYVEGTGLGLSICKTIVELLGGTIGVSSEPGKGSRFWFRIRKKQ